MKKSKNQQATKNVTVGIERWLDDIARFASGPSTTRTLLERAPVDEREAAWQANERKDIADSIEINAGLARLGIPFELGDLRAVRAPYPEAIPLLIHHLEKPHTDGVWLTIVGALRVPYGGREVFDAVYRFLQFYRDERSPLVPQGMGSHHAYALGDVLSEIADKSRTAELSDLILDERNGSARLEPLFRLARWKSPTAVEVAKRMLERNDHSWYALHALRLAKARDAADLARLYLAHDNVEFRAEARRYLNFLEKPPTPSRSKPK